MTAVVIGFYHTLERDEAGVEKLDVFIKKLYCIYLQRFWLDCACLMLYAKLLGL